MDMKKTILTWLMLAVSAAGFADTGLSLFVTFTDNSVVEFALADEPALSVADDKLTVATNQTTLTYPLQQVVKLTYATTTAIEATTVEGLSIGQDRIVVDGTGHRVTVFALDGSKTSVGATTDGGRTIVPLGGLSKGIYIVSIDGKSIKIARK